MPAVGNGSLEDCIEVVGRKGLELEIEGRKLILLVIDPVIALEGLLCDVVAVGMGCPCRSVVVGVDIGFKVEASVEVEAYLVPVCLGPGVYGILDRVVYCLLYIIQCVVVEDLEHLCQFVCAPRSGRGREAVTLCKVQVADCLVLIACGRVDLLHVVRLGERKSHAE